KGLGNLAIPFLRPIAFSGELSYAVADRELKQFRLTDPITNLPALSDNRGSSNAWFGAFSIQYSLPYLQSQVKDVGLGRFFGHLVPIA
ncbi:hypothetical protein, partial [Enterococcus faecium]|uniref:hypothetical protein n=1 Tax=Enterococcus faecium TaxID=1352 RepID=UPI003F43F16C